jgi:hypothetical protein
MSKFRDYSMPKYDFDLPKMNPQNFFCPFVEHICCVTNSDTFMDFCRKMISLQCCAVRLTVSRLKEKVRCI